VRASARKDADEWIGVMEDEGLVIWRCPHHHATREQASDCAWEQHRTRVEAIEEEDAMTWTPEATELSRKLAVSLGQMPGKENAMTQERSVANVFLDSPEGVRVHFQITEGTPTEDVLTLGLTVDALIQAKANEGYSAAVMQDRGGRQPQPAAPRQQNQQQGNNQPRNGIRAVSRPPASSEACDFCGGDTWDNTENKRNPKGPDYKCKARNCGAAAWVQEDGTLFWKAGA
jgi:hypothetical protein